MAASASLKLNLNFISMNMEQRQIISRLVCFSVQFLETSQ